MVPESPLESPRDQRGFALLIVLWIFIVLIAVGAEFSAAMRQDVTATMNFAGETQSYYLATAAANRTFYRALIARDEASIDIPLEEQEEEPLIRVDGQWHRQELWGAPVWVRISDESGKIPVNLVTDGLLRQILGHLGLDAEQADEIAAGILDWRDEDDEVRVNGAETDYYLDQPRPYAAKNAKMDSLEELLLIRGVTWDLYHGETEDYPIGLKHIFTVFNPRPVLNIRSSPPEVLQALFGLDEEQLGQILEIRNTGTGSLFGLIEPMLPDPSLADLLSDEPPNILFVEVQAQVPGSRVGAHIAAVIDLGESNEGVYILRWFDQLPFADVDRGQLEFQEAA
ncbi:MAG: type II secretion system protein GspK [Candidatus Binatia bacterium]|nr:type II secretion system protein GspK [Candidatus Binatia bacterium]